jgi:hypothetical protein
MDLVDPIRRRVAVVAIGASTVRGQGVKGVVAAAREFLFTVQLKRFGTSSMQAFEAELDKATADLKTAFPQKAKSWGLARKCMNIFLRDCYYNFYLHKHFDLDRSKDFHEVPLDRKVAEALRDKVSGLPRWLGVKHLTRSMSDAYQQGARQLAKEWEIERVHLDTFLWTDGIHI